MVSKAFLFFELRKYNDKHPGIDVIVPIPGIHKLLLIGLHLRSNFAPYTK